MRVKALFEYRDNTGQVSIVEFSTTDKLKGLWKENEIVADEDKVAYKTVGEFVRFAFGEISNDSNYKNAKLRGIVK